MSDIQKAIDFLKSLKENTPKTLLTEQERECYEIAISALERQMWIPCGEHKDLPKPVYDEEFRRVLVTTTLKSSPVCEVLYWHRFKKFSFISNPNSNITKFITAWQPLPEPYKPEQ